MEKFAERLKDLRTEKGLTQRQLAKATGLSQTAIAQWENKLRQPGAGVIIILARYFEISADYLLDLED